ncbi:MAG: ribosome biogenesis GTP-binding protein YihA/YsxC [Nitrospira sp.]|nr:ribosome biogenesis GTP-binding protein YihA/YsxC [Nitrospira sp.]HMW85364.1 ribosome biogenesis GTP-binding protein YihA/YsxC [Nitrospira sp.]HMZ96984.1 ribosome biogenesis GTP-binding protein YihA/YsxC [Nitrospira sp.]HNE31653.1 ribosome biogenesis GTP-binding protein YihA/YsxC [Nitrospira sp.]HNG51944.1 ribosome biogenesis GTP-binding protein YihA/YsxC [Nitrospira sp.]
MAHLSSVAQVGAHPALLPDAIIMKLLSAEFIKSSVSPEQFPADHLPEIAFVGRSNVGKSSLINSLLHRKKLAKVSKTPGKTRAVNFFTVRTSDPKLPLLSLVDLPGYGYAKVSKTMRAQWGPMIEQYLEQRQSLGAVILLIESRVWMPQDVMTIQWVQSLGCGLIIVLTKADKLRQSERKPTLTEVRVACGLPAEVPVLLYSAETHEGRDALWGEIRAQFNGLQKHESGTRELR